MVGRGNISLYMQHKKERVIELRNKKDRLNSQMAGSGIAFMTLLLLVLYRTNRLIPNIIGGNFSLPSLVPADLVLLIMAVAVFMLYTSLGKRYNKTNKQYDVLRTDIMDDIGSHICSCNELCQCKEQLIKELLDNGIDLIIR